MDVVRHINKALSYADIQRNLGGDAKITQYSELGNAYDIGHLLPRDKDYCIIFYENKPNRGHWTAHLIITVSTSTLTPTASSQKVR